MFVLFNVLFGIVALILDNLLDINIDRTPYGPLYALYILFAFLPGLAVAVRRLHDLGKSGWMVLVSLIPIAGSIWLIILFATEGDKGDNEYGPDSKETTESTPEDAMVKDETSDTILLVVLIWMFVSHFYYSLFQFFDIDFYDSDVFRITSRLIRMIWAFIPLILAFNVKSPNKRIVVFILGGIYLLHGLFMMLKEFF